MRRNALLILTRRNLRSIEIVQYLDQVGDMSFLESVRWVYPVPTRSCEHESRDGFQPSPQQRVRAIFANTSSRYIRTLESQVTHLRFYSADFYCSPNSAPISVTSSSSCCRPLVITDSQTPLKHKYRRIDVPKDLYLLFK